ncbi:hypothetical protein [Vibrio ziniensis]|uniref:Uncharacterized protein n=1 Tax=Vibrio ziniensis TaxID=2711221 RepID=A0A6G7CEH8_9VIBR|nr:hypothetical protein [Vibrio ziniensis]QIH40473.1 hypothetical protein G5S32_00030 [Vibrio ziniensis]
MAFFYNTKIFYHGLEREKVDLISIYEAGNAAAGGFPLTRPKGEFASLMIVFKYCFTEGYLL